MSTQSVLTCQTIVSAALRVFSEVGYEQAKVDQIAKRAGVNSVTVYRHFRDKKNLFLSVVRTYGTVTVDEESISRQLSYANIAQDLMVLAFAYFEAIFQGVDIVRIFISEGNYFKELKKQVWYVPPSLQDHFSAYLQRINTRHRSTKKTRQMLGELFLSHIIVCALDYSERESGREITGEIRQNFHIRMQKQLPCMLAMLQRRRFIQGEPSK